MKRAIHDIKRRDALKAIGGVAVASAGGLAGCTGNGGAGQGNSASNRSGNSTNQSNGWPDLSGSNVHFITVAAEDNIQSLWEGIAGDFEEATGASMKVEFVQTGSLDRIIQLIQGGDPPEVSMQSIGEAYQLQNQGALEPVGQEYKNTTDKLGQPTGSVQNVIKNDGSIWMVPLLHNINVYTYRSDLSNIVPDTWEKVLQYASDVDSQSDDIRGNYVPISTGSPSTVRFVSWLWTNGGSISKWENDEIKVNLNEGKYRKRTIETLNFLKERQQYSLPGSGADWADIQNIIQSGEAASSWYAGTRQKTAAIENDRPFAGDIHITPGMPTNRNETTDGSTEGLVAYKGSNTKGGKAFIRYVTRRNFLVNLLTELSPIHNIPSYPEVKEGNQYQNKITSLDIWDGWNMKQFNNYQDKALSKIRNKTQETSPPNPYTVTYYSEPIWNLQSDVLLEDKDPGEVIDQRAKQLQETINEAQN